MKQQQPAVRADLTPQQKPCPYDAHGGSAVPHSQAPQLMQTLVYGMKQSAGKERGFPFHFLGAASAGDPPLDIRRTVRTDTD